MEPLLGTCFRCCNWVSAQNWDLDADGLGGGADWEMQKWGMGWRWETRGLRPHLLLFHLALFPVVIQGQELVLGEAGGMAELPCKSPQEKSIHFSWKDSSGTTILGTQSSNSAPVFLVTGRVAWLPIPGEKHSGLNIQDVRAPGAHYVTHTLGQSSGPQLPQTL